MGKTLKRFWIWWTCKHQNTTRIWRDADGWNIKACRRCGRAVIYTDNKIRELP